MTQQPDSEPLTSTEWAVKDVVEDGMTLMGAAVLWNVQADELRRRVEEARAENGQPPQHP